MIAGDHEASHVSVRRKLKKNQWKEGCKQKKSHGIEHLVLALLGNLRFFSPFLTDPSKSKSVIRPRSSMGLKRWDFIPTDLDLVLRKSGWRGKKGRLSRLLGVLFFFFVDFHFFSFLKGLELSGDFGNWTTPGTAFVFVFFSRWLPAQSSFFPVGLGPPLCSFLWAMPPAGMGATGRYEACGMLDFDCMVGWQPVLTIFQYHFSVKESSIGRWWLNSIFLGWCLSSFVSAYFNLWVYAVRLSFQEYSQLGP